MRYCRHNIHTAEIHPQQSQGCLSSVDKHIDNGRQFAFGRRSSKWPDRTVHQELQNSQKKPKRTCLARALAVGDGTFPAPGSSPPQGCRGASGGWDVQQDTRNTRGSSRAEPLGHAAPAPALTGHGLSGTTWASNGPLLCCPSAGSFLPLVIYTISQLLECFLTNSAGKQGAGEPPWVKRCGGAG